MKVDHLSMIFCLPSTLLHGPSIDGLCKSVDGSVECVDGLTKYVDGSGKGIDGIRMCVDGPARSVDGRCERAD